MKILPLLAALLFLLSCGSVAPLRSMEDSVNIHVECRNDPGTKQLVLQLLRQAKARDVRTEVNAETLDIQASYYTDDNPLWKLTQIADLLTMQSAVYHVEMMNNHTVVKDPR